MNRLFEWLTGIRPVPVNGRWPDKTEAAVSDTRLAVVPPLLRREGRPYFWHSDGDWTIFVAVGFVAVERAPDREDVLHFTDALDGLWESTDYPEYVEDAQRMLRGREIAE